MERYGLTSVIIDMLSTSLAGTSTGILHHELFQNGRNFPMALFIQAVEGFVFIGLVS